MPKFLRSRLLWSAVLFCGLPGAAVTQTIVGVVTLESTGEPLHGAWVVLEAEEGSQSGGTLSRADGGYVIQAPGPGRYRLVVEHIGYGSTRTEFVSLGEDEAVRRDIRVSETAIDLESITVEVEQRCRPRPGSGPATNRLWQEARTALEVARWTGEQSVRFKTFRYYRRLEVGTHNVLSQELVPAGSHHYEGSPYVSIAPDSLRDHGFVQLGPEGEIDYYGPDATTLLSDDFLDTHCFRVEPPRTASEGHLIGLAFEPVPGRSVSDIEGVLWLDRRTGILDRVDFVYVNFPFAPRARWDNVGGRVEFERLSNGMWIVRRWRVRMPLVRETHVGEYLSNDRQTQLAALNEVGGEVVSAISSQGTPLLAAEAASLSGRVRYGHDGPTLIGATVRVRGTPWGATTGREGSYRIGPMTPGRYTVLTNHPELSSVGVPDHETIVELEAGENRELLLTLAPPVEAAERACGASDARYAGPALLHGAVTDSTTDRPVPYAVVRLSQDASSGSQVRRTLRTTVTDSSGLWWVCLDPALGEVLAAAVRREDAMAHVADDDWRQTDVSNAGFIRLELSPVRPQITAGTSRLPIQGLIRDPSTRSPVEGAIVTVSDSAGVTLRQTTTNREGQFAFPSMERGPLTMEVEALGYRTTAGEVTYTGEALFLEMELSPEPLGVEGISVSVATQKNHLRVQGFYDRVEKGIGRFLTPEDIAERRVSRTAELFDRLNGVELSGDREPVFERNIMQSMQGFCVPNLYVDGVPVRLDPFPQPERLRPNGLETFEALVPPPELIDAIEAYPGGASIPPQWGGSSAACGVIVVWTKR